MNWTLFKSMKFRIYDKGLRNLTMIKEKLSQYHNIRSSNLPNFRGSWKTKRSYVPWETSFIRSRELIICYTLNQTHPNSIPPSQLVDAATSKTLSKVYQKNMTLQSLPFQSLTGELSEIEHPSIYTYKHSETKNPIEISLTWMT